MSPVRRRGSAPLATALAAILLLLLTAAWGETPPEGLRKHSKKIILPARLHILPLPSTTVDQSATISWRSDEPEVFDQKAVPSITWYYATDLHGRNRTRVVTVFCDTFDGDLLSRWVPVNALREDFEIQREGRNRRGDAFVRIRAAGDPLVSLDHFQDEFVVSARLRPLPAAAGYGLGVWASRESQECYALRGAAELLNPGAAMPRVKRTPVPAVTPRDWYWYEIGIKSKGKFQREPVLRGRIWDANHEELLCSSLSLIGGGGQKCPEGQRIALLPGADYSEIYVDHWTARYPTRQGSLTWLTQNVPEGRYYLVAVIDDANGGPVRQRVSDFQVEVRHPQR